MKISPVLVAAVAAKAPAPRGSAPRIVRTCGGTITDQLETNIQSFGYPGYYSDYLNCAWKIQHDCAQSFTITANAFDLEGVSGCRYDKLLFSSDSWGDQALSFCGGPSYSSNYLTTVGSETISTNGMPAPITIPGNQLFITFTTDYSVIRTGFDLDIQVNCDALFEPTPECFEYPNFNGRATAYYNTEPGLDIPVPISTFSQSKPWTRPCSFECVGTAGCFKVYHDTATNTCELRGNELEPVAGVTKAFDGNYCDGEGGRVWTDAVTETRVYCLFRTVESADNYLDYLNRQNPAMLDWITVQRVNDGGPQRDRISSTSIWSFEVAQGRTSSYGTWYTFHSTTYYREFLPSGATGRRRRQADDTEIFRVLSEESAADFVQNLEIGETAEVLETEDPVIETEILEEVVPAPAEEFRAAFDEFETVMRAAFDALPWQPPVPMLALTKTRFEWFPDFADAPCARPAGQGPGAGDDYVAAVIDTEDLCGTVFSFHDALFGFYDDFVCLDRSSEADIPTRYRMEQRMPILLAETKIVFNRFLNKLSCPTRIEVPAE